MTQGFAAFKKYAHLCVLILAFAPLLLRANETPSTTWQPYPKDLPQFHYTREDIKNKWSQLAGVTYLPYPDKNVAEQILTQYPKLKAHMLKMSKLPDAHPALKEAAKGNVEPYIDAMLDVWALHFSGKFEQSYQQGLALGPLGALPAIHSKLMYAVLMVKDKEEKLRLLKEAQTFIETYYELAPTHPYVMFGRAYNRARILELLSNTQAIASGYLSQTREQLIEMSADYPDRPIYEVMLGGLYAGIVERVGSFIGTLTYGANEGRALKAFERAIATGNTLPVIFNEYAIALARMDSDEHHEKIIQMLKRCVNAEALSAEEALNQRACEIRYAEHLKQQ